VNRLDREGTFKAKPLSWKVQQSKQTQSVGINFEFQILAQLVEMKKPGSGESYDGWHSWEEYDPVNCYGTFYVIGRDGQQNVKAIDQLVVSGLWNCDFNAILGPVPDVVVQIQVKAEEYEGQTRYKVSWVNPEDHVPGPSGGATGASADEIGKLQARFGSLLRAAAAGAKKGAKPPAPKPAAAAAPVAAEPSKPAAAVAVAEPGANDGTDISGWSRKAAIARLGEAPDSKIRSAINDAGLSGVVKTRMDVAALDDEALKRFDNALFDQDTPF
jgi:hypothetical protein